MKKNKLIVLTLGLVGLLSACGTTGLNSASRSSASSSGAASITSSSAEVCSGEANGGTSLPAQPSKDVTYPTALPAATEPTVALHYRRSDAKYSTWTLWLWAKGSDGLTYAFNYQDDFGVTAYYPLSTFGASTETASLGFIIYYLSGTSWVKDVSTDCFIDFSAITKENNVYNAYILSGDTTIYTSPDLTKNDVISGALFSGISTVGWTANKKVSSFELDENGSQIAEGEVCATSGTITLPKAASVVNSYVLKLTFATSQKVLQKSVSTTALYKLTSFDDNYAYDGADLGAVYASAKTVFKVWSPISSAVTLNLYLKGTPSEDPTPYATYPMSKGDKGVFSSSVEGDLSGKYYTYAVTNQFFANKEIVDPYAKGCGLNGARGMVVNFAAADPAGWDEVTPKPYDRKSLVVWETHVADVTSSATWTGTESNREKYPGLVESGTTYTSPTYGKTVTTGFDHIKELGVNAVQIMPIFDQANDEANPTFNWGYNPLNYNCLEGVYSTNPSDGYTRIREFKNVVQKFNEAGINVIMDVVYNHVSGLEGSNFDVLMPGYYFRYNADGTASNGSGCGNETASEMKMFRKFMIDSTGFWAQEYKLGGFRFDLMGLHDLETMNEVTAHLKTINPSICVYGEPWTGGTTTLASDLQAKQANGNSFVGYGAFNDGMRDALIKGGLHASSELGWVTDSTKTSSADVTSILAGLKGTTLNNGVTIADPDKTTNYVTCHDNYTLRDRLYVSGGVGSSGSTLAKAGVLANSFPLLSQGTSFMLSGDEFSRTKADNSNSYNASYKINELNYDLKARFSDFVGYYEKLIALKTSVDGLHLKAAAAASVEVEALANGEIIKQVFKDTAASKEYVAYHVSGDATTAYPSIDLTGYDLYLDTFGNARSGSFIPSKYEVIVGVKSL